VNVGGASVGDGGIGVGVGGTGVAVGVGAAHATSARTQSASAQNTNNFVFIFSSALDNFPNCPTKSKPDSRPHESGSTTQITMPASASRKRDPGLRVQEPEVDPPPTQAGKFSSGRRAGE